MAELSQDDLNAWKIVSKDYEMALETQRHFNDLLIRFRTVGFTSLYVFISYEFDVFIEDELAEAINLPQSVGKVYLLDYPWTKTADNVGLEPRFTRVENWTHLIEQPYMDFPGAVR